MNKDELNFPELDYRQAAKATGYSVAYLQKLVVQKGIVYYKVGPKQDRVRFRLSDLQKFMNVKKVKPIE